MEQNNEEDTYNRLRRIPYIEACVLYTLIAMGYPSETPQEIIDEAVREELAIAGWTVDDLNAEGSRREREEMKATQFVRA